MVVASSAEPPLTGYAGVVSCIAEEICEGDLFRIEITETLVITVVILVRS